MSDSLLIEASLGSGLDETTDDAFTPATKCRLANNVIFPDTETSAKRSGLSVALTNTPFTRIFAHDSEIIGIDPTTWIASAYSTSQGTSQIRNYVSPCMASRALLASGSTPAAGSATPTAQPFNQPIIPFGSVAEDPVTKLRVYAWSNGGTISASIWDTVQGAYVQTATVLAPGAGDQTGSLANQPRVCMIGSSAFVMFWDQTSAFSAFVQYIGIDLTNVAAGWGAEASTGLRIDDTHGLFDACPCVSGPAGATNMIALTSASNTSGTLEVANFIAASPTIMAATGGVHTVTSWTPSNFIIECIGIAATNASVAPNNQVAIAVGRRSTALLVNTYDLQWTVFQPNPGGVPTVIRLYTNLESSTSTAGSPINEPLDYESVGLVATYSTGTGPGATQQWMLVYTRDYYVAPTFYAGGAVNGQYETTSFYYRAQATDISVGTTYGPFLGYQTLSKPIAFGGLTNFDQNVYVLLAAQDGNRVGFGANSPNPLPTGQSVVLVRLLADYNFAPWHQPIPAAVCAPRFAGSVVPLTMDAAPFSSGLGFTCIGTEEDQAGVTSITALSFDFASTNLWQTVRLGPWSYIAGGLLMLYDGSDLTEVGFINQPGQLTVSLPSSGSTRIPAIANLTYQVCYAQQDAAGNIHRSPPSVATVVDASAGYAHSLVGIQTLAMTLRQTQTGEAAVNPVRIEVYRNNSNTPTVMQLLAVLPNDPSIPIYSWTDSVADNANATAPELYTFGGGVPSDGPPNLSALCVHADRVFGVSEDGQTAYFTTALVRGEAPRFTDAFTLTWPRAPITAQWSLESRLHGATAGDISFVFGSGPNDNDTGSDLTLPDDWQYGMGVVDARGVCLFQGGAILNTSKGIYVEDRGGNFTWLGQRFQRTYNANPVVTGMIALENEGVIRIALQTTNGNTAFGSPVIHWDYHNDRISTHSQSPQSGMLSIANASGVYYGLANVFGAGTNLVREDAETYMDAGTWVTAAIVLGWMRPAGMQGYGRMRLVQVMGLQNTPATIEVQVARDYASHFDSTIGVYQDAAVASSPSAPTFQLQFRPATEKSESFSFFVNDAPPGSLPVGIGRGPTWKTISGLWAVKPGQYRRLGSKEMA